MAKTSGMKGKRKCIVCMQMKPIEKLDRFSKEESHFDSDDMPKVFYMCKEGEKCD